MAPADCAYPGWLDLGDAVAIAYGPSEGYDGAADPKKSASWLIAKVCTPFRSPHDDAARPDCHVTPQGSWEVPRHLPEILGGSTSPRSSRPGCHVTPVDLTAHLRCSVDLTEHIRCSEGSHRASEMPGQSHRASEML